MAAVGHIGKTAVLITSAVFVLKNTKMYVSGVYLGHSRYFAFMFWNFWNLKIVIDNNNNIYINKPSNVHF